MDFEVKMTIFTGLLANFALCAKFHRFLIIMVGSGYVTGEGLGYDLNFNNRY